MEPTETFHPFGLEGPKVLLFGRQTGDWNPCHLQGNYLDHPELYFRLDGLGKKFGFKQLFLPTPTDCNAKIVGIKKFLNSIHNGHGSLKVMRGVMSDGVVLPRDSAGAIASADCPTIVAHCPVTHSTVVGHGGFKSLIGDCTSKKPKGVVDSIVFTMQHVGCLHPQIFVTCGIRYYERKDLASYVGQHYPKAVRGDVVSLHDLIACQFEEHGIGGVMTETIDTYWDVKDGLPKWHSHRRAQTARDKAARNLVLVVNS